jgi:hypothetical protein
MVRGTPIRHDDRSVVAVPLEEVERLRLRDGQVVTVDIRATEEDDAGVDRAAWSRVVLRNLARDWDSDADRVYDQLS